MDIEKINMQMTIEEIDNTCQVGKCFEDRDELKILRTNLYKFIELLDQYERNNFEIY